MSITAERRTALIGEYKTGSDDTGSPEVQVAILTERLVAPDRSPRTRTVCFLTFSLLF
jgi:hypothetical protein